MAERGLELGRHDCNRLGRYQQSLYPRPHCRHQKEAIKIAINAGIDMSMVPYEVSFCTWLKELVEEGEVPMSRIDDAVRRVLRLKYRLGLFEHPYWNIEEYGKFGSSEFAQVALKAAEESLVLLKNEENILPLTQGKKILLTGPNANSMRSLNGGWSYSGKVTRPMNVQELIIPSTKPYAINMAKNRLFMNRA